jgi:hypothetical protein
MYSHPNELEEVGIISLTGVKVEHSVDMEKLLSVRPVKYDLYNRLTILPIEIKSPYTLYGFQLVCL